MIYGHGTFGLSFNDNHSDTSIATIRQLVEIRVRRATGVMWKTAVVDNAVHPIALSDIFDAIDANRQGTHFPLHFDNLRRINSWANIYLHSGMRIASYTWSPPRILNYLRPFALGEVQPGAGHRMHSGVRMTREAFGSIRSLIADNQSGRPRRRWWCVIDQLCQRPAKFNMFFYGPEQCDVIFTN